MRLFYLGFAFLLAFFIFFGCDREWNNPWDENAVIASSAWAPYELTIVGSNSFNEVTLSWKERDRRHEGYNIERRMEGDHRWILVASSIASSGSDSVSYKDSGIDLQRQGYVYRVSASVRGRNSEHTNEVLISLPRVRTLKLEQLPSGGLVILGEVERTGSDSIISRGFILAKQHNPLINNGDKVTSSTSSGIFNAQLPSNIEKGTTYYFRAYAETEVGVGYGEVFSVEGY